MLLSDYLKIGESLENIGVFDPILDKDNAFFINIQRLKETTTPEFEGSYDRINDFFRKIIKLLDRAEQKSLKDTYFRAAFDIFKFSEVNGICLGFGEKAPGSGFGPKISKMVLETAYDIIKAGIEDPEFFQLLPLFQDNVGPDRLSDMIATLILPDTQAYTERVNQQLGITIDNYPDKLFNNGLLCNPVKGYEVLLLPTEILHKLPVAKSWEEIDSVIVENNTIRAMMNNEVAEHWTQWAATDRKYYLREKIFKDSEKCKQVIEAYREERLDAYNPEEQIDYFLAKLWQRIEKSGISWLSKHKSREIDSKAASLEILNLFKNWVEYNRGWEVILSAGTQKREKIVQRVIHLSGIAYIRANNLSLSCEADEGRGPVDFKISRGQDITVIEVKLSSNGQYMHGYDTQVEEYAKAEGMFDLIEGKEKHCEFDGVETVIKEDGKYCCVPVTHKVTLGEIVDLLQQFKEQPTTLMMPKMPEGSFAKKLYSLYLTYLPTEKFKYALKMNVDDRGSFTELVHTQDCGQVSINISRPGITKGQHWHNSKWELFIVVAGHGLIQERNINTGEKVEFEVSGDKIEAIHMIPGWTHNIINLSETENLVTVMTCNEIFNPERPDTFFEIV